MTLPNDGRPIIHRWTPGPEWDIAKAAVVADVADEYVVVSLPHAWGGVMVWARYGERWIPNASARPLLAHLLGAGPAAEVGPETDPDRPCGWCGGRKGEHGVPGPCPGKWGAP